MYQRVVVTGGSSLLAGLEVRLAAEIQALERRLHRAEPQDKKAVKIAVEAAPLRRYLVCTWAEFDHLDSPPKRVTC